MLLKSLEIMGFKSFPDRINIQFDKGITAIVGPNGSGKSNIADAIRWVFGEQSVKMLRGNKMEDIIFGGTQLRSPQGFAEVSLTIDNSDHILPFEYEEVSITRRFYRSGESEYFINKSLARLKDINELFMDTGLGRDGYSVIGQGRIADVLSLKKEDRRQIFEEAAGISKYRYRKEEANRKLNNANENLIRLNDIKNELEERVGPLEEESIKAKKYLALRDNKKRLEINTWLHSIAMVDVNVKEVNDDLQVISKQYNEVSDKSKNLDSKNDENFSLMQKKAIEIDEARQNSREKENLSLSLLSKAAVLENDLKYAQDEKQNLLSLIEQNKNKAEDINEKIKELTLKLNDKNHVINEKEKEIDIKNKELDDLLKTSSEYGDILREKQEKISNFDKRITDIKISLSSLQSSKNEKEQSNNNVKIRFDELNNLLNEAKEKLTDENLKKENAKKQILKNDNIITGLSKVLASRELSYNEAKQNFEKSENYLSALKEKKAMLEDLEKHFEGFYNSVKMVMKQSKAGNLKNVHGPVSKLITMDERYFTAVETALGSAMQNIVVDNEQDAKAAVMFLKQANAGRATFLPISSVKGNAINEQGIENNRGFVGIASKLVNFDKKYENVINFILGRVIVADHIDNAINLSKKYNYRYRIVTLDGQVINAGGAITGGSVSKSTGILGRNEAIIKTDEKIKEVEIKSKELYDLQQKLFNELSVSNNEMEIAKADKRANEDLLLSIEASLSSVNLNILSIENDYKSLKAQMEQFEILNLNIDKNIKENNEELASLEENKNIISKEIEDIENASGDIFSKRKELIDALSALRIGLVSLNGEKDQINSSINMLKQQNDENYRQNDEINVKIKLAEEKFENIAQEIKSTKLQSEESLKLSESLKEKVLILTNERQNLEKEINESSKLQREFSNEKELLAKEITKLENKKISIENEKDEYIKSLWEEYEMTFSEALSQKEEVNDLNENLKEIKKLKNQIKALGNVNVNSIEEYESVSSRYNFLKEQIDDIIKAKSDLEKIIKDLTSHMILVFSDKMKEISACFNEVFVQLFGGGMARLVVVDEGDILESPIEIEVRPPGKVIKNIASLSGGEQAFVAIALYFAMQKVRPTPFCVLDEIEAALDDVNVDRFASYLRNLCHQTQFISITHRRGTMEEADVLYGVTMQEKGVSKILKINASEVEKTLKKAVI